VEAHHPRPPNGADDDPAPPGIDTGGEPLVGFVGIVGDRVDTAVLEAVLDSGVHLLLVGPSQRTASPGRLQRLLARPEVHWVGPRDYRDLPQVLAAADVWLLPYGNSAFNRASFPLKVLEYLAAGRRVVATDLPAVRWLDTDLVAVADSPERFAHTVLAELGSELTEAEALRRSGFADGHGWEARVRGLAEQMGLATVGGAAGREVR
jgi:teichuronic acid biosynthesis glycosyltransferase TuaH